jgi:trigger factor
VKAEYRKIAERRVRLGLVIGEIGEKASVEVGQDELRRALIEQARRYPGQENSSTSTTRRTRGADRAARADLRGEGDRSHPRARPSLATRR